jgi:GntR family transcriptional regulator
MLPFNVQFKTGMPVYEQVIYAVHKAVISGQLKEGDKFPSVRQLSQDLRINPNTAHKIVTHLLNEGLLEVKPGIGTIVSRPLHSNGEHIRSLLGDEIERLVVEAKRLQVDVKDVLEAVKQHWNHLKEETR